MASDKINSLNGGSTKGFISTPPPQTKPQTGLIPTPPPSNVPPPPPAPSKSK